MLMDIIGVAVGFSVIMLLLSLIVTSLSQATQALLRLRGRNLRHGLAAALRTALPGSNENNLLEASDLMNRADDTGLRRREIPASIWSRILGPALTWIDDDGLRQVLREKANEINASVADKLSADQIEKSIDRVTDQFHRLQNSLTNRFEQFMRGISLIWALIVALVFQVSTPMLLQQLSTDPALRYQLLSTASASLEQGRPNAVSGQAAPDGNAAAAKAYVDLAIADIESRMNDLSRITLTPMRYGREFYTEGTQAIANILGVLMTAIFLTLGAPFWYNALETAVKWRDLFAPKRTKKEQESNDAESGK